MNKTALITGASRGIGFETSKKLLKNDQVSTLVLLARASEAFDAAITELNVTAQSLGKSIKPFAVDVGDRELLLAAVDQIHSEVGDIDILVNNAGYTSPVPIHQIKFDDFQRTMAVNLYAPFTLVQALLQVGNKFELIVNIASTAGINGRSGWLTYSASKAALINMSEVLREELSIYDTRVACISPGRTATGLRRVLAPEEDPTTIMQATDVASVIELLMSPVGQFIDSENLVVRQ